MRTVVRKACTALVLVCSPLLALPGRAQQDVVTSSPIDLRSGQLQLVVFVSGAQEDHSGIKIQVAGRAPLFTNSEGAAHVDLGGGENCIEIGVPPSLGKHAKGYIVHPVCSVSIVESESTQVLVTLDATGLEILAIERTTPEQVAATRQAASSYREALDNGQLGIVKGTLRSADQHLPIVGARVFVRGLPVEATANRKGEFELNLPAGSYRVSIIHPEYATHTESDVSVEAGGRSSLSVELTPSAAELDDFVITAPYVQGGVAELLSTRRKSSSLTDALGSEDLAKSPDGSASSATRRIVGASIVGGQFLFVRGLGGRYSNVRLNNVLLPSTDPDLPGFQLDLFPSSLLSSLTIAKTFSPDIPANFAGGSLNIETRGFPEKFTVSGSVGLSYNSETTFSEQPAQAAGSYDWIGVGGSERELPNGFPSRAVTNANYSRTENTAIASALNPEWEPSTEGALPNVSLGLTLGNTLPLGATDKLSFLATVGYRRGYANYVERVTNASLQTVDDVQQLTPREVFEREVGVKRTQLGMLGSASYQVNDNNSVTTVALLTQNGDSQTSLVQGFSENENAETSDQTLKFVERRLLFNQLLGQHEQLGGLLDFRWQVNTASTLRSQPDTRRTLYADRPYGFSFVSRSGSGERLFTNLDQRDFGAGLDFVLSLPGEASLKFGYLGRTAERQFSARRLRSEVVTSEIEPLLLLPNELFSRQGAGEQWRLTEVTSPTDGFAAEEDTHAGYSMVELPLFSSIRGMVGTRWEYYRQAISVAPPIEVEGDAVIREGERADTDAMWAGALVAAVTDSMNLRAAYGGTVARPLVRELAPFLSQDFTRRRTVQGNPELQRTFIHNFDLRWEYFMNPTEVFAASLFYKVFDDPIESVIVSQNGDIGYANIDRAENLGLELEARFDLAHVSPSLLGFNLGANLALVDSKVSLFEEQAANATSQERPLAGQSPYVVNVALGYEPSGADFSLFAFYNVFGRRIQDVGRQGLPDVYEEPFHSVDLTGFYELGEGLKLSGTVSNLAFQEQRVTQGDLDFRRSGRGGNASVKLSWSPE